MIADPRTPARLFRSLFSRTGSLSTAEWSIILGCLSLLILAANRLLPVPDNNDFDGLGRICLLMERKGLRFSLNDNWGFAHPLLCYLLTKATDNLLLSQRILAAFASVLAIVFSEIVMRRTFGMASTAVRTGVLLAMIFSPWMLEAVVSVHLDIIPVALVAGALALLLSEAPLTRFLSGVLIASAYWFRFHLLVAAGLYPILVYLCSSRITRRRNSTRSLIGVMVGVSVPILFSYAAFGVPAVSNQKAVLAGLSASFSWSVDYQTSIEKLGYLQLIRQIAWFRTIHLRMLELLGRPAFCVFLFIVEFEFLRCLTRRSPESDSSSLRDRSRECLRRPPIAAIAFICLAFLPFVFLRGLPLRLEATVILLAFPWLATLVRKRASFSFGLVAALFLVSVIEIPATFVNFRQAASLYTRLDADLAKVLPPAVSTETPETLLNAIDNYGNRRNRYWLWSPILIGGWPLHSKWIRDEFGVLNLNQLYQTGHYRQFRYLLLSRNAQFAFEGYDKRLLQVGTCENVTDGYLVAVEKTGSLHGSLASSATSGLLTREFSPLFGEYPRLPGTEY